MTQALQQRARPHRQRARLILAAAILAAAGQAIVHPSGARPLHDPAITAPSARFLHVQQAPSLGLAVAPEHRCAPYNRPDYPYPQAVEARIIATMGGRIYGPYTGRFFTTPRHTDIEHIVALSEAHDSGLCAADAALKHRFAADLLNLTLAVPAVNRCGPAGKCAKDAGEWLPPMNQWNWRLVRACYARWSRPGRSDRPHRLGGWRNRAFFNGLLEWLPPMMLVRSTRRRGKTKIPPQSSSSRRMAKPPSPRYASPWRETRSMTPFSTGC